MIVKRPKTAILIFWIILLAIFAALTLRNYLPYPENEFKITGKEPMCLSHLYNVNGIVGAEKRDFTARERQELMQFISQLEYKEPMPIQTETIYGVPVRLTVENKDGTKTIFSFNEDIGVKKYGKAGNVLSQGIYTTSEKQQNKIYKILGIERE